ncbi:hypothetical protein HYDPIDRAFT_84013 [Hydnomerulius pinastri MD-312]|nr:hypothetical protein HYDPIDRAFT_84013 [Hydnomerulius pinastri MD-312]
MNLNTTITNDSPLLFYVPQSLWYQAPPNDVLLSSYETQSYHATNGSQGQGSVSFSFTGTGIWLYGGYRTTLGAYTVVLDGEAFSQDGYHAGDPEQANYVLFGNNNLTSNQHTVQLINTSEDPARNVLDISQVCSRVLR